MYHTAVKVNICFLVRAVNRLSKQVLSFVYFSKKLNLCARCSCCAWSVTKNAIALEELLPAFK